MTDRIAPTVRFLQTYCVLDHDLRLLWVGGDWDEFALANNGAGNVADQVLSTCLTDHICDRDTTEAVGALVRVVRDCQKDLRLDYRCDSPVMTRRFQMTIQPMKEDRVLIVHDLRDARTLDRPLHPWHGDSGAVACKCSFCCAVNLGDAAWTAPEELTVEHPDRVRYTLCPECRSRIAATIEATAAGQSEKLPVSGSFGP